MRLTAHFFFLFPFFAEKKQLIFINVLPAVPKTLIPGRYFPPFPLVFSPQCRTP